MFDDDRAGPQGSSNPFPVAGYLLWIFLGFFAVHFRFSCCTPTISAMKGGHSLSSVLKVVFAGKQQGRYPVNAWEPEDGGCFYRVKVRMAGTFLEGKKRKIVAQRFVVDMGRIDASSSASLGALCSRV